MSSKSEENDFLPDVLYGQIVKRLPIVSVDALIVVDGALLLVRRNNEPVKGEWWVPGGRIHKGESLEEALRREILEETGLELKDCRLINVYSRVFPERHDITIAYLCHCKRGQVKLNSEHSEYALFKRMPPGLHPYLLETVRDSKWKKRS